MFIRRPYCSLRSSRMITKLFVLVLFWTLINTIELKRRNGKRILGGSNTTIRNHPYQLSIQFKKSHICGASLIAKDIVLTAAHCMGKSTEEYSVRAGSTFKEKGGQVRQVSVYKNHPKHGTRPNIADYDVSVLKLQSGFWLGSSVQIIKLLPVGKIILEGTIGVATGWGSTQENGPLSNNLQQVEVPKLSQSKCVAQYLRRLKNMEVSNRMICFGLFKGGKDSCMADSGGPIVVKKHQVGITSFGKGCGRPYFSGVYVRIANEEIRSFINSFLRKFQRKKFKRVL